MNLLIAIMGDSYEKVKESERVQALRERAQIIVEAERRNPSWHKYHKYMHIVEAADISTSSAQKNVEWEGITGRVKQLLEMQDRRVDSKFEAMDSKFAEIGNHFEMMDRKLDEAKTNALADKADAQSKFEELKSLMNIFLSRTMAT